MNALQIIGFMGYFNVYWPVNAKTFYIAVLEMAEFNLFEVDDFTEIAFPFLEINDVRPSTN